MKNIAKELKNLKKKEAELKVEMQLMQDEEIRKRKETMILFCRGMYHIRAKLRIAYKTWDQMLSQVGIDFHNWYYLKDTISIDNIDDYYPQLKGFFNVLVAKIAKGVNPSDNRYNSWEPLYLLMYHQDYFKMLFVDDKFNRETEVIKRTERIKINKELRGEVEGIMIPFGTTNIPKKVFDAMINW